MALTAASLAACSSEPPASNGAGGNGGTAGGGGSAGAGGSDVPIVTKCDLPSNAPPQDPLTYLGRADSPSFIEILDVVQAHPIVYSCTSVQGLNIWNADNGNLLAGAISPPGLAGGNNGNLPHCQHVGLDAPNQRIVITNRGDEIQPQPFIHLFDVSDPSTPLPLGGWTGPESIEGVVLDGNRIYAAAHGAGVMVMNIDASNAITEVARFTDAESDAWQVLKHGDYLLVAEGARGLRVYDITSDQPALVASVPIDGSAKDVVVAGNVAYVAASSRIVSINITNPAAPTILDEVQTAGTAVALAIGRNHTLLVAEWEKLRGYDISNPYDMRRELSEVMPTNADHSRILTLDAAPDAGRVYAGEWSGMHGYNQAECGIGPDIETTPDHLSFPTLPAGESEQRTLTVGNYGNRPLNIDSIITNSPTLTFDGAAVTINPGATLDLAVTFTPTDSMPIQAGLRFSSDDLDQSPFDLGVSANVVGVNVGDPLPSFSLMDTEGNSYNTAQLKGNVVLLAYFATF